MAKSAAAYSVVSEVPLSTGEIEVAVVLGTYPSCS